MKVNYNIRKFISKSNTNAGEVDDETVFYYEQDGNLLFTTYSGGSIVSGQMLGVVETNGKLKFNYQHLNLDGILRSGHCTSNPETLDDGMIQLLETWKWNDEDMSERLSIVEEEK